MFESQNQEVGSYHDGAGISQNPARLAYCYEPIFGYGLENFPFNASQVNWIYGPRIDPRCYLKGSDCVPGTVLSGDPNKTEDLQRLETYSLKEKNQIIRWLKPPSLTLYVFGFVLSLLAFFWMMKQEFFGTL